MPESRPLTNSPQEPLPECLETLREGIALDEPNRIMAGLEEFFATFKDLTSRRLALMLGKKPRTVQLWRQYGKGPKPDLIPLLHDVYRQMEAGSDGGSMQDVCYASEDVTYEMPRQEIRIGVPPVWDSALYTAFDQLLLKYDIQGKFGFLQGWSKDAFSHLEDNRFDVLIHNRFLAAAARHDNPHLNLRMSHGLYVYRGQFVFLRRDHVQEVADGSRDSTIKKDLNAFLGEPYELFGDQLRFPKLLSREARRAVLDQAQPAYVPGTDHEEAMRQLYEHAFSASNWLDLSKQHKCRKETFSVKQLAEGFTSAKARYHVFCGGLPFFWRFANEPDTPYLTICDPLEFHIPSLNGLVVLNKRLPDLQDKLDDVARAFYTGIRLFKDWQFASGDATRYKTIIEHEHLIHLMRVAIEAPLLETEPAASITLPETAGHQDVRRTELSTEELIRIAHAWSRLMVRYVEFFVSARETNALRLKPDMRDYVKNVTELIERGRG